MKRIFVVYKENGDIVHGPFPSLESAVAEARNISMANHCSVMVNEAVARGIVCFTKSAEYRSL